MVPRKKFPEVTNTNLEFVGATIIDAVSGTTVFGATILKTRPRFLVQLNQ